MNLSAINNACLSLSRKSRAAGNAWLFVEAAKGSVKILLCCFLWMSICAGSASGYAGDPPQGRLIATFSYSPDGLRIEKQGERGTERYTYDDQSVLSQRDGNNQLIAHYTYGPNRLIALEHKTEGVQFYLTDALNSVANLMNSNGLVQARYQYDAFGNKRSESGTSWNRFAFTGYEEDKETNLLYAKARYYDADTARFLSQDAWAGDNNTPPSLHKYLYAYQNPTVWIDPTGNAPIIEQMASQLHEWSDDINKRSLAIRQDTGGAAGHGAATAWEVLGAAPLSLMASGADAVNLVADAEISRGASYAEAAGYRFSEYGVVGDARANLSNTANGLSQTVSKLGSRDGRSDLGTPLVEWGADLANGNAVAAQKLSSFSGETLIGAGMPRAMITVENPAGFGAVAQAETKSLQTINNNVANGVGTGAENVNAGAALNRKLSALEGAQNNAARIRKLPDGRVRYYEAERAARNPGSTRGSSYVTEYNPANGNVRSWNENYDQAGNINRVHPKMINGQTVDSQHYPPTAIELGLQ